MHFAIFTHKSERSLYKEIFKTGTVVTYTTKISFLIISFITVCTVNISNENQIMLYKTHR